MRFVQNDTKIFHQFACIGTIYVASFEFTAKSENKIAKTALKYEKYN